MDVKYTLGHEHQNGPVLCFECDKWIAGGDAVSVTIESRSEDGQPLTGFLHKVCALKLGLPIDSAVGNGT